MLGSTMFVSIVSLLFSVLCLQGVKASDAKTYFEVSDHGSEYKYVSVYFDEETFTEFYTCLCQGVAQTCTAVYILSYHDDKIVNETKPEGIFSGNSTAKFYKCQHFAYKMTMECIRQHPISDESCNKTLCQAFCPVGEGICSDECVNFVWKFDKEGLNYTDGSILRHKEFSSIRGSTVTTMSSLYASSQTSEGISMNSAILDSFHISTSLTTFMVPFSSPGFAATLLPSLLKPSMGYFVEENDSTQITQLSVETLMHTSSSFNYVTDFSSEISTLSSTPFSYESTETSVNKYTSRIFSSYRVSPSLTTTAATNYNDILNNTATSVTPTPVTFSPKASKTTEFHRHKFNDNSPLTIACVIAGFLAASVLVIIGMFVYIRVIIPRKYDLVGSYTYPGSTGATSLEYLQLEFSY